MKRFQFIILAIAGTAGIMAGCAFMDLVWSRFISRADMKLARRIAGVETCREMSHRSFQTWRIFASAGHRTYYLRSECFQQMAVRNRDEDLCREVVERKSLYFDGSAVSEKTCREAVRRQIELDRRAASAGEAHRIAGMTISRTPYGEAAVVRITTTGSLRGMYLLTFFLYDERGNFIGVLKAEKIRLENTGFDGPATIIYHQDIQTLLGPRYRKDESYILEARLETMKSGSTARSPDHDKSPQTASTLRQNVVFD